MIPVQEKTAPKLNLGKPSKSSAVNIEKRDLPALDWIHVIFLFYSGAHNAINAWGRAENGLFFIFVLVGILSVELMLWSIYKYWKNGTLIGKMMRVGKIAGALALFYATAGILAQAQTGSANDWLTIYYQWILPSSAPVMFFMAFWIQSVDPITTAQRDISAFAYLSAIEERRETLDERRGALKDKKNRRLLRENLLGKKIVALWKESDSRRTKGTLKRSSVVEMPELLEAVGVSVKSANDIGKLNSISLRYKNPKQLPQSTKQNTPVNPRTIPGAHEKK